MGIFFTCMYSLKKNYVNVHIVAITIILNLCIIKYVSNVKYTAMYNVNKHIFDVLGTLAISGVRQFTYKRNICIQIIYCDEELTIFLISDTNWVNFLLTEHFLIKQEDFYKDYNDQNHTICFYFKWKKKSRLKKKLATAFTSL
ncbi:hypothetical protein EGW08_008430 [Elysia chlorotica]|uniref:Uncharacterized protein n=1 Tax=Elysia chlorotica TaxID=188477 RepID=A0A3S0ZVC5_ELYCH|nr:hypothetical protein EGW08_008430 [Elysia chlorotica]